MEYAINNNLANELLNNINEELDDNWIIEYEKENQLYKDFYKDNIYYINLIIIYINKNNDIDKIKNNPFLLKTPNIISQDELVGILKYNSINDGIKYSLLSILRYNINLNPDDIKKIIKNNVNYDFFNYLSVIKNINDIHFEKSINMFHDLNDIIIIFNENISSTNNKNKKNITKKVYLLNNIKKIKKTIRNRSSI